MRRMPDPITSPAKSRLPATYGLWLAGALVSQLGDAALYFALGWAASAIGGSASGLVLSAIVLPRTGVAAARRCSRRSRGRAPGDDRRRRSDAAGRRYARRGRCGRGNRAGVPGDRRPGDRHRRCVLPALARLDAAAPRRRRTSRACCDGAPERWPARHDSRRSARRVLVAAAGFAAATWTDAATFALVLVVLVVIRPGVDVPTPEHPASVRRSVFDGVRIAVRTPGLASALLLVAAAAGFVIPSSSLLVPLLARERGWGAATAGLIVGAQGVGVIVSTLVVARRGSARRPGVAAAAGLATTAVGQTLVALMSPAGAARSWPCSSASATGPPSPPSHRCCSAAARAPTSRASSPC